MSRHLADIVRSFKNYKALGDAALAQVPDEHLHSEVDPNSNSVAVIVSHVSGNLHSRFRDFLTTDGEKPDRDRNGEFDMRERASREQIVAWWNDGLGDRAGVDRGPRAGGSRSDGDDSRGGVSGGRGFEPIGDAYGVSRRSDCLSRAALRGGGLEDADNSEGRVREVRERRLQEEGDRALIVNFDGAAE
jgi:hypothetical protein